MNYESSASHRSYHFLLSRSPLASCWLSLQCVRKKKSLLTMCSFFIFLSNSVSPWQCSYTSTFSFGCTRISLGNSVFFFLPLHTLHFSWPVIVNIGQRMHGSVWKRSSLPPNGACVLYMPMNVVYRVEWQTGDEICLLSIGVEPEMCDSDTVNH